MKRLLALAALVAAATSTGCSFDKTAVQDIAGPLAASQVRFFNFGVNAPTVNFYVNDTKFSATVSATGTEAVSGVSYGSVSTGTGYYSAITPGSYTVKGKVATTVDKDVSISNVAATIADGKAYSVYLSGFYDATAKTVEGFVVEDPIPTTLDPTMAYVRFVNAISNSTPQTLYAKNTTSTVETALGAGVAYKSAGAFTPVVQGIYDLNTRTAGSTANAVSRTGVSFLGGRVYTISSRGDMTVVSTTATNRPFLDNTANR